MKVNIKALKKRIDNQLKIMNANVEKVKDESTKEILINQIIGFIAGVRSGLFLNVSNPDLSEICEFNQWLNTKLFEVREKLPVTNASQTKRVGERAIERLNYKEDLIKNILNWQQNNQFTYEELAAKSIRSLEIINDHIDAV